MAQGLGTIYHVTIECVTPTGAAKLISIEKEAFTTDTAAPTTYTIVKQANANGGGVHLGSAKPGDRYVVDIASPDAAPAVDESSASITQVVGLAGSAVLSQLGELTAYD